MPPRTIPIVGELVAVDSGNDNWKLLRYLYDCYQTRKGLDIVTGIDLGDRKRMAA